MRKELSQTDESVMSQAEQWEQGLGAGVLGESLNLAIFVIGHTMGECPGNHLEVGNTQIG